MKRIINIILIGICLLSLIAIRKFENILFYDPLLYFFKQSEFNHLHIPPFNIIKLFISLFFRFFLNSIISMIIIQLWFKNKKITIFSCYIFIMGFIVFVISYLLSITTNFGLGYMPTFYIRRILIQPILLLLLIPAIYYYKFSKN